MSVKINDIKSDNKHITDDIHTDKMPEPISLKEFNKHPNIIENACYWDTIGYKLPLVIPNDRKAIDYLIDMFKIDTIRALTQGITVATKILTDEEFDIFIKVCYDRSDKYKYITDISSKWPSDIFSDETWNRIIKSYGANIPIEQLKYFNHFKSYYQWNIKQWNIKQSKYSNYINKNSFLPFLE